MSKKSTYYSSPEIDYDVELYIANAQISTPSKQTAIRSLVRYMKMNDLWNRTKILYPMLTDYKNPIIYTEDFSNSAWTKTGLTVSASPGLVPAGITTASFIVPTAANTEHKVEQATSFYTQGNQTVSIYAKAGGYNWIRLTCLCSGNAFYVKSVWFDLQNGVFGSAVGGAALINTASTNVGNGWYRIELTIQNNGDTGRSGITLYAAAQSADAQTNFTGNGTDGIHITGAQLDFIGTNATTYEACLGASRMPDQMKYNLRDPRDADSAFRIVWTAYNTLAFSPYWGVKSNSTSGYGNTKLVASTSLSQNDVSASVFSCAVNSSGSARFEFGNYDGAGSLSLGLGYNLNGLRTRVNSITASDVTQPSNDTRGLTTINRTNSTQQKIYKNGALISTQASNSDGLGSVEIPILALREFGTVKYWSQQNVGFFVLGGGYSDSEIGLLYNGLYDFQTAIGRQL